jgi:flagellar biogenesis protein FliO
MKALKKAFLFLVLVLLFVVVASEAGGEEDATFSMEPLRETEEAGLHQRGAQLLGLLVLMGIFAYGAFLWHRRRGRPQGTNIRVLAVKPLGQREKVAILDVLGERMVLGITAHRISLLSQGPTSFSTMMRHEDEKV